MAPNPDHPNDAGTWTRLEGREGSPCGAASVRPRRQLRCTMSWRLRGRARFSTSRPRLTPASTKSPVSRAKNPSPDVQYCRTTGWRGKGGGLRRASRHVCERLPEMASDADHHPGPRSALYEAMAFE